MVRNPIFCIDPYQRHKKQIKTGLRKVTNNIVKKCGVKIEKGAWICINCLNSLSKEDAMIQPEAHQSGSDIQDINTDSNASFTSSTSVVSSLVSSLDMEINTVLPLLKETPVKKRGLTISQKRSKGKKKYEHVTTVVKRKLESSYGIELPCSSKQIKVDSDKLKYQKIFQELKETYQSSNYQKKIQILTLSPFTIKKTMKFFNTSLRMVRKSRKLKKEIGLLPEIPSISKGVVITNEQKSIVKKFYESDEISRCCPGMKEYLTVRNADGEKVKEQKRLLLGNLKELFQLYKNEPNNPKIGFSTFAKLRPKYCVLAGSGGTHSVCVCTYHQNVKLQIAAIGDVSLNYRDLMNYSVCSSENSNCMMHFCKDCPREQGITSYLESLDSLDNHSNEINYSQWVAVDRCTMVYVSESLNEYIVSLSKKISYLTRHHYIAQAQSKYFKELKNSQIESEAIAVGDFSENYSFIVQDAIQGFHWENSQCTVHPFVLYYKNTNDQEVRHTSFCILSDVTKHNTVMVYVFLSRLIPDIKLALPTLKKVHYFSYGCAGQYKNKYNFSNICHHEEDFNISCEWNFFATSHGKSSCDGIGGTVKRAVARESLRRICTDQILTPQDMFDFCKHKFDTKIQFYFVPESEVEEGNKKLKQRYEGCKTITGTQKYHRIVPLNKHEILCYNISSGIDGEKKLLKKQVDLNIPNEIIHINKTDLQVGTFVGCIYEKQLWFAMIENYIEEFDDYAVSFLHPPNISLTYAFPERLDHCAVPYEHIVKVMSLPTLKGGSRINYVFNVNEVKKCFQEFKKALANLVK